jgi:antitoxin CcdA
MSTSIAVTRKATNVTIDADLLASAKLLKINISRATEDGLKRAVAARQAELWLDANRAALESSNAYVDQKGLPLARFRNF